MLQGIQGAHSPCGRVHAAHGGKDADGSSAETGREVKRQRQGKEATDGGKGSGNVRGSKISIGCSETGFLCSLRKKQRWEEIRRRRAERAQEKSKQTLQPSYKDSVLLVSLQQM